MSTGSPTLTFLRLAGLRALIVWLLPCGPFSVTVPCARSMASIVVISVTRCPPPLRASAWLCTGLPRLLRPRRWWALRRLVSGPARPPLDIGDFDHVACKPARRSYVRLIDVDGGFGPVGSASNGDHAGLEVDGGDRGLRFYRLGDLALWGLAPVWC